MRLVPRPAPRLAPPAALLAAVLAAPAAAQDAASGAPPGAGSPIEATPGIATVVTIRDLTLSVGELRLNLLLTPAQLESLAAAMGGLDATVATAEPDPAPNGD